MSQTRPGHVVSPAMRGLVCESFDGIDALRVTEVPDPMPGPGVGVAIVEAACVNYADSLLVSGQYQVRPELPFVIGSEFAGVVEDAGGVPGLADGDRIAAYVGFGAMAEKALAEPGSTIRLPRHLSTVAGAAVPVAYGTGYHALVDRAMLHAGERLLVLGAAGGVGLAAVQIGKALGAEVIAAVSSDEKEALVRDSGADHVIRYETTPLREAIADVAGKDGVDVVYDPVGGDVTEQALRSTGWNGRLLMIGFASGEIPRISLNLSLVKGNSIVGVFWGRFVIEEPEHSRANNRVIEEWLADGVLRPKVQRTFTLEEGAEAVRWVAQRRALGRVVVTP